MKGRILLVHEFFDVLGGGEFLALNVARALKESGYDVIILTYTPINASKIRRIFGIDVTNFSVIVKHAPTANKVRRVSRGRLSILSRLMTYKECFTYLSEINRDYDLIMETQSNLPSPADISYMHYPALMYLHKGKESGIHRRIYSNILRAYASRFRSIMPGRVFTNSSWTAAQIYRVHHIIADVIYPPVNVEYFSRVSGNDKREKLVITISRLTLEKKLDRIVEVAAKLKDHTFVIIGSTCEGFNEAINKIMEKTKELNVDNVVVEPDLPRVKVLEYLSRARFYLHPEYAEHFGIAVVEAMAAGLIPIVYRDGGAWHDIVSRVCDMLGYGSIEEAPKIIQQINSDSNLYGRLKERSMKISKMFSYESFRKNLLEKVEYVLKVKNIASNRSEF